MTPPNYRGRVVCGETVTGNTSNFGPGLNNRAPDNWFKFDVIEIGPHSFNACASAYDTWLRVSQDTYWCHRDPIGKGLGKVSCDNR